MSRFKRRWSNSNTTASCRPAGAFVERFDEAAVLEHHELDGLLNGIASARAATSPTPRILGQLDALMRSLRTAKESRAFSEIARE